MPAKFINFQCPQCAQVIEAPVEMAATNAQCPTCGAVIVIPGAKRKSSVWKYFFLRGLVCVALLACAAAFLWFYRPFEQVMATPRKATAPITGAFGFTLGEKLPMEYEIKKGYGWVDYTAAPPITTVQLGCLSDRTIYTIVGYGTSNSEQVVKALEMKYGDGGLEFTKLGERHFWTNADNRLEAERYGDDREYIRVSYTSGTVEQRLFDEEEKAKTDAATNLAPKL